MGRFAEQPPVPGAEIFEWTEPQSSGVGFGSEGPEGRQPDVSTYCRAWAINLDTMQQFLSALDGWRIDLAASVEVSVRDRGRSDERDLVVVLMDYGGDEFFTPGVVEGRRADGSPA